MTLLVIGATDDNARRIASAAASRGVRVVTQATSSRPGNTVMMHTGSDSF